MAGADPSDYVTRLELWLAGRQANAHAEISTTNVRAEPYDRTSSSYTLAESDLRALLDEREQLEQQLFEARVRLTGAQARLDYLDGRASGRKADA